MPTAPVACVSPSTGARLEGIQSLENQRQLGYAQMDPVLLDRLNTEDREDRLLVRLAEVPDSLLVTLLTTEDRDFYQHGGVSPVAIMRAMAANLLAGAPCRGQYAHPAARQELLPDP